MGGGAFRRAGAAAVVVTAVGAGMTGCALIKHSTSADARTAAGAAANMTAGTAMTTGTATGTSMTTAAPTTAVATGPVTVPTVVISTTPSPTGSICPDAPGTERIVKQSTTTVDGSFALVGFKEITICGPGVLDDIQYQNTGSLTTFVIPADAKVTLLGTSASTEYEVGVTQLEDLLAEHAAPGSPYVLWSNYFELTLDSSGRITGVISLYHP